jgi:hypothetical protein
MPMHTSGDVHVYAVDGSSLGLALVMVKAESDGRLWGAMVLEGVDDLDPMEVLLDMRTEPYEEGELEAMGESLMAGATPPVRFAVPLARPPLFLLEQRA